MIDGNNKCAVFHLLYPSVFYPYKNKKINKRPESILLCAQLARGFG